MGKHEVFLRYGQVERLEAALAALRQASAVILQAKLIRARLAFRKFHGLRRATVRCQAQWRMLRQRSQFATQRRAAIRIQAQVRRFQLHALFQRMKRAAAVLTSASRRFVTRCNFLRFVKHTRAAVEVQRHVRGFMLRTAAERERKLRTRMALRLQTWQRMQVLRRVFLTQRQAAVRIQAEHRARAQRRRFLCEKRAAIVVAAFVRQVLQHRRFRLLKTRVVKTQALVRKWAARRRFLTLRRALVTVQSFRRQRAARRTFVARKSAVGCLQHAMAGWIKRWQYVAMKRSVRRLQYWATSWLLRRQFQRARGASRRIQKVWRTHHRRVKWEAEVASVFGGRGASRATAGVVVGGSSSSSWTQHARMEASDRRMLKLRSQPDVFITLQPRAFGYDSLFHQAAACGDFHVVKYMLDECNSDALLTLKNGRGLTAFHEACAHGEHAMVKFLALRTSAMLTRGRPPLPSPSTKTELETPSPRDRPEDAEVRPADVVEAQQQESNAADERTVIFSGFLRKRRETSRWLRRYVVLSVSTSRPDQPQLDYYVNDRKATLAAPSGRQIDLTTALLKTSVDLPFAFELHSPQLLRGHNKEGRLYFAASSALEIQRWLAHLRNSIPSSVEARVFAMHRSKQSGALEFVDFRARHEACNLSSASSRQETPLHLVASCSSPTVVEEPEDHSYDNSSDDLQLETKARPRALLDGELKLVRTAQWLLENGANANALTSRQETPLQLALQAGHLALAKLLLDRGALASGLSETQLEQVRRLKAELAKTAISSISSAACTSVVSPRASNRPATSLLAAGNALLRRPSKSASEQETPLLFLLKQPGKLRHSSYVSLFVELIGLDQAAALARRRPRLLLSVLDAQRNLVEMRQQVSVQPAVAPNALVWGFTWHMQTPLENLPHGACVVLELATTSTASQSVASSDGATSPTLGVNVLAPECWTYLQVDQRTANSAPVTAEMYRYPVDLSSQHTLQPADAFLSGEMLISQPESSET
ncbi:hypothetical protein BBJ28_00016687 [Nothophytophthora sp. Chile5]|nr:hypothetical protein BBJ28_00016687 [Nothophytophthora sp. Chile5]